jgi:cell division protein FtsZ
MTINFRAPEVTELKPRITVLGVGGAGGNAVNNMITAKLEGVSFVVANTDAQALHQSKANRKIQLGAKLTEGLGAGAKPEIGRGAAEESIDEILEHLSGSHMVFVTAGMGGGTGTGAAPVIARAVRELGILTVGVVTKPFHFEGDKRMKSADRGIEELQNFVDTLIVIPNQNLFRVANERTTFAQAFSMADEVLHSGVRGITDLIVMPGLINRDFADIRTVMSEMGKAMMGTGEMEGEGRALRAAEAAISNPLLDDVSMKGAHAVLVNVTGGPDLMLFEVDEAVNRIRAEVDSDANILFGSALLENMEGRVRVSVVATGIDAESCTGYVAENVQRLHIPRRRTTIETEAPAPVAAPASRMDAPSISRMMDNLAVQLDTLQMTSPASEPVVRKEPTPVIPVPPPKVQMEEPLVLGGADMPIISEPVSQTHTVTMHIEPKPAASPTKRFLGLFGRRRTEREEYPVEPRMEAPMPATTAVRQPIATPTTRPTVTAPAQPVAQPQQAQAPSARAAAEPPRQQHTPSADDLFAGVSEDDRFEIPAFLRRQANSGG